jgi:hypothetical protein
MRISILTSCTSVKYYRLSPVGYASDLDPGYPKAAFLYLLKQRLREREEPLYNSPVAGWINYEQKKIREILEI